MEPNPYEAPTAYGWANSSSPLILRFASILRGGAIRLVVGAIWTALIGPLTDGPPSIALSFIVYVSALTFTGLVVGAVRRLPALVGLVMGILTLSVLAVIVGPKDGWIVLWVMVFGGSGMICGSFIGGLFYILRSPSIVEPNAASDRGG